MLTPHTALEYFKPLYSQPAGVITIFSVYGSWLRPSSTSRRIYCIVKIKTEKKYKEMITYQTIGVEFKITTCRSSKKKYLLLF